MVQWLFTWVLQCQWQCFKGKHSAHCYPKKLRISNTENKVKNFKLPHRNQCLSVRSKHNKEKTHLWNHKKLFSQKYVRDFKNLQIIHTHFKRVWWEYCHSILIQWKHRKKNAEQVNAAEHASVSDGPRLPPSWRLRVPYLSSCFWCFSSLAWAFICCTSIVSGFLLRMYSSWFPIHKAKIRLLILRRGA